MTPEFVTGLLTFLVIVLLLIQFCLSRWLAKDEEKYHQEWKREREIMAGQDAEKEARL